MTEAVSTPREIAVIGKTIRIRGDVAGEESLVIDGTVEGTVLLEKHDCTVGQTGRVTGDVKANVVRIQGQVTGDVDGAEKVVVTKTGRVDGNIVAPRVTLEDGAKFKGSIDMDPGAAEPAAPPKPELSAASSPPDSPRPATSPAAR
jgi:cytoskeletal protein CcmA (bactofilin family)